MCLCKTESEFVVGGYLFLDKIQHMACVVLFMCRFVLFCFSGFACNNTLVLSHRFFVLKRFCERKNVVKQKEVFFCLCHRDAMPK